VEYGWNRRASRWQWEPGRRVSQVVHLSRVCVMSRGYALLNCTNGTLLDSPCARLPSPYRWVYWNDQCARCKLFLNFPFRAKVGTMKFLSGRVRNVRGRRSFIFLTRQHCWFTVCWTFSMPVTIVLCPGRCVGLALHPYGHVIIKITSLRRLIIFYYEYRTTLRKSE